LNFGNRPEPVAGIHGAKWLDENGNGRRDDGEPGLAGWTIRLDDGAGSIVSTVTDEAGRYWFMELPGGEYTVTEVLQEGWQQTWPPAGNYQFLFDPSQSIDGLNFGNRPEPVAGIHGAKWLDENGNGQWDDGEPGLAGVTIYIDLNTNKVFDDGDLWKVTDGDGNYAFKDVTPGTIQVRESKPDGIRQTFPIAGFHEFLLEPGHVVYGVEFGNIELPPGKLQPGSFFSITAAGFKPGTLVKAFLQSDPVLIGQKFADVNGKVIFHLTIPLDFPPGEHSLILLGKNPDDSERQLTYPLTIESVGIIFQDGFE